jgi:hypothetical protein
MSMHWSRIKPPFLTAVICLALVHLLYPVTQESAPGPLRIQRVEGIITLDGKPNEPAWQKIRPLPVIQFLPTYQAPLTEKTEIRFTYDDNFIYIAGHLYDSEPDKIMAPSRKRDYFAASTEWFGIVLDTFNDKENGLSFMTTPSSLRFDSSVFNDAQGEMPLNLSWNTFWDTVSTQDEKGWFVEMRIPLSSLRYQPREGKVVMGLIIWRFIARKNEMHIFPDIPPKWGNWSGWKVSRAREIVFEGIQSKKPLYITPYALGGSGRNFELNDEETAYVRERSPVTELGLDVKYSLTSNLTMDLTINTDFAQVEADDVQVNLTRFSLFFPEKRLFFQERSSTFDFSFDGSNSLFYSRRIGINDEEAVRIYGGMRLVGRLGAWDIGFLDMQTAPSEDLSSENFGVLRLRRRLFNRYSYAGGMLTSRLGTGGHYNAAYGLDGIFRVSENDYLLLNWAQTFQNGFANRPFSLDPAKIRIAWERRTFIGLGLDLSLSRAGKDYDPGLGFEMREDYTRIGNRILYGWNPGEKSPFFNHHIFADGFLVMRNPDGSTESAELGPGWNVSGRSGFIGEIAFKIYREGLVEPFELTDDITIPIGDYTFTGIKGYYSTPGGKRLSAYGEFEMGSFFDGKRATFSIQPQYVLAKDLNLTGYYQINWLDFPERDQSLLAHITRLKLEATLSLKFTATAFVQYNSATDAVIANVRLRYNPKEGNDLYIVYNENLNTNRGRYSPFKPYSSGRAIMIKYSHTFKLND